MVIASVWTGDSHTDSGLVLAAALLAGSLVASAWQRWWMRGHSRRAEPQASSAEPAGRDAMRATLSAADASESPVTAEAGSFIIGALARRSFVAGVRAICQDAGVECELGWRRELVFRRLVVDVTGPQPNVARAVRAIRTWAAEGFPYLTAG